jgi:hypothetical protein
MSIPLSFRAYFVLHQTRYLWSAYSVCQLYGLGMIGASAKIGTVFGKELDHPFSHIYGWEHHSQVQGRSIGALAVRVSAIGA